MRHQRIDATGETVLRIEGTLDAISAPDLRETIDAIVSERRQLVTVDLASLRMIDGSGVGALVSLYKRVHEQGGAVRAVGVLNQPLAIFRLLQLDAYFCEVGDHGFASAAEAGLNA
jgi:anti-sigma B factor antagonist